MDKKNILVIVPSFDSGGTGTSLMNFVSLMDKNKYSISVFAITNTGVNRDFVAQYCRVIGYNPGASNAREKPSLRDRVFKVVKSLKKGLCKIGIDISPLLFKYYASRIDNPKNDFVLAFQEGQATLFASYLKYGTKVAWVRCEFTRLIDGSKSITRLSEIYGKYDKIVSVSNAAVNSFVSVLPQYKDRTYTLHNFLNDERVVRLSTEQIDDVPKSDLFTVISIGRIDPIKRFSAIPSIVAELKGRGLKLRWLIVGGNVSETEYAKLQSEIKKNHVEDDVILTGNKKNPYPYLKMSNLLVSLSISETFNNTLTEAKILGVPVVTSNYACAHESVAYGEEGLIVPFEDIPDAVARMIQNEDGIYDKVYDILAKFKYDNTKLLEYLCNVILK